MGPARRLGWGARALALAAVFVALHPAPGAGAELVLSVAASLKDAVEETGRGFARAHPGVVLRYNVGASGALARQIEAGAPVDVFIAAGADPMDQLERRGHLVPGTRRALAGNRLVVAVPAASAPGRQLGDLTGPPGARPAREILAAARRIVMANPKTTPAGRYAEAALDALGLGAALQPRLVLAEDARQALVYVARGEVDAGIVYATDALGRPGAVRTAALLPADSHPPVIYPGAVVRGTRELARARAVLDALAGAPGREAFDRRGFLAPPENAR